MKKISIGMYVRTKKRTLQPPQIARIRNMSKDSGYKNQYYIELDKNLIPGYEYHIYEEDVLKASHNIIDLIEVGDYVNGYKVLGTNLKLLWWDDELGEQDENEGIELEGYGYIYPNSNYHFEINSIVTKEAFSSVEYRVETD